MYEISPDLEYLIHVTEGSRLNHVKKFYFVRLLVQADEAKVAAFAAQTRKDEDSFEITVLNLLSDAKIVHTKGGEHKFLTFDQLQIRNALATVRS